MMCVVSAGFVNRTSGQVLRSKDRQIILNGLNYITSKNPEKNVSLTMSETV
jgi:hypothetical protein